jgi:hypothetical protein
VEFLVRGLSPPARERAARPPPQIGLPAGLIWRFRPHVRAARGPSPRRLAARTHGDPREKPEVSPRFGLGVTAASRLLVARSSAARGQRYWRAVVTISYRLAHSTVSDSRFGADAKVEFAREFLF